MFPTPKYSLTHFGFLLRVTIFGFVILIKFHNLANVYDDYATVATIWMTFTLPYSNKHGLQCNMFEIIHVLPSIYRAKLSSVASLLADCQTQLVPANKSLSSYPYTDPDPERC